MEDHHEVQSAYFMAPFCHITFDLQPAQITNLKGFPRENDICYRNNNLWWTRHWNSKIGRMTRSCLREFVKLPHKQYKVRGSSEVAQSGVFWRPCENCTRPVVWISALKWIQTTWQEAFSKFCYHGTLNRYLEGFRHIWGPILKSEGDTSSSIELTFQLHDHTFDPTKSDGMV